MPEAVGRWEQWLNRMTHANKPDPNPLLAEIRHDWPLGEFPSRVRLTMLNESPVTGFDRGWYGYGHGEQRGPYPYPPKSTFTCGPSVRFVLLGKNGTHAIVMVVDYFSDARCASGLDVQA